MLGFGGLWTSGLCGLCVFIDFNFVLLVWYRCSITLFCGLRGFAFCGCTCGFGCFKCVSLLWVLVVLHVVWFLCFVFGIMRAELFDLCDGAWLLGVVVLCLCTLGFSFCGFCVLGCFRVTLNSVALFCIYGDALICLFHFNFEGFRCLLVFLVLYLFVTACVFMVSVLVLVFLLRFCCWFGLFVCMWCLHDLWCYLFSFEIARCFVLF